MPSLDDAEQAVSADGGARLFDRILVPTNGSLQSSAAAGYGLRLAQLSGATLHGLYVVEHSRVTDRPFSQDFAESRSEINALVCQELQAQGRHVIEQLARRAESADVSFAAAFLSGRPYESIVRYVDDHDIDAVIIGKGGSRAEDCLLGDTTDNVLRLSDVPVVAVRHPPSI